MVKKYEWYKADDVKAPFARKQKKQAPKVRAGIVPGSVLILLAGRFRGKRVVFLKQLKSGLLAVTGPYKINGVPVKRVNQVYTLTTSTKVDLKGVKTDSISDETFTRKVKKTRKHKFLESEAPAKELDDSRKKLQKEVDGPIVTALKDKMMQKYLGARFSLGKNDAPHSMKF